MWGLGALGLSDSRNVGLWEFGVVGLGAVGCGTIRLWGIWDCGNCGAVGTWNCGNVGLWDYGGGEDVRMWEGVLSPCMTTALAGRHPDLEEARHAQVN